MFEMIPSINKTVYIYYLIYKKNSNIAIKNKDFWKGLTSEQRKQIFELAARTEARAHILYSKAASSALEDAKKSGQTKEAMPGESLQKAVQEWIDNGVGDMAGIAKDTYKIEDPQAVFSTFEPYVKKWGELVRGMKDRNDEEELTKLIMDNMFNDLDPDKYGMD